MSQITWSVPYKCCVLGESFVHVLILIIYKIDSNVNGKALVIKLAVQHTFKYFMHMKLECLKLAKIMEPVLTPSQIF